MILGTLSLFQKRGVFYKEQQLYADDRFSTMIDQQLEPDEVMQPFDLLEQFQITPVEESGNTDYITAFYEDEGKTEYPYEVTIWLLVEEVPEEIHNGHLE